MIFCKKFILIFIDIPVCSVWLCLLNLLVKSVNAIEFAISVPRIDNSTNWFHGCYSVKTRNPNKKAWAANQIRIHTYAYTHACTLTHVQMVLGYIFDWEGFSIIVIYDAEGRNKMTIMEHKLKKFWNYHYHCKKSKKFFKSNISFYSEKNSGYGLKNNLL